MDDLTVYYYNYPVCKKLYPMYLDSDLKQYFDTIGLPITGFREYSLKHVGSRYKTRRGNAYSTSLLKQYLNESTRRQNTC